MATKTKEVKKTGGKPGTAVAKAGRGGSLALQKSLKDRIKKDANKGLSTNMSDNIVPLVYVLQAQSPQTQKRNEKYVEGAEAGSLWLRNSADPIVDGEEGFDFQPCFYWRGFIEWQPNRGGFVARHNSKPEGTKVKKIKNDKGDEVEAMVTPAGNILVESMEWAGFVLGRGAPMGYVIPCSGSNRGFSKELMTALNNRFDEDNNKLPAWWNIVRIKSKYRTNDKGSWFMFDFDPEIGEISTEEDYIRGQRLNAAFEGGEKQAAVDETSQGGVSSDDDNDDI